MKKLVSFLIATLATLIIVSVNYNCEDAVVYEQPIYYTSSTTSTPSTFPTPYLSYISINDNDEFTDYTEISIKISSQNATEMILDESSNFSSGTWQSIKSYTTFNLSDGNGVKRVYCKVRNAEGIESSAKSDTITFTDPATTKQFWVINNNMQYEKMDFLPTGTGNNCIVYLEKNVYNTYKSENDIVQLPDEFDDNIYPKVTQYFGQPHDVDSNNKIFILYYDFTWAGGYYAPSNYFSQPNSNEADMVHVTTFYFAYGSSWPTVAHEFQHLCNFNQNYVLEPLHNEMDLYLNEGLSVYAEEVVYGIEQSFLYAYNSDYNERIKNGHPLVVWEQEYEDYALSYIFVGYLAAQVGTHSICYDITTDTDNDSNCVVNQAKNWGIIGTNDTWETLFEQFTMARLLNNPSGPYGFNDHYNLNSPQLCTLLNVTLKPGGAVYKNISGSVTPTNYGTDINFFGIVTPDGTTSHTSPYTGDTLIAYNRSINDNGSAHPIGQFTTYFTLDKFANPLLHEKYIPMPYCMPIPRDMPLEFRKRFGIKK